MSLFDVSERAVLDAYFGSGSPASYQLGLSTAQPLEDGSVLYECTGPSYSRVSLLNNVTNFPAAVTSGGVTTKKNGVDISFPIATTSWGGASHWFLYDVTNSRLMTWGVLNPPRTITSGDLLRILTGQLIITLD